MLCSSLTQLPQTDLYSIITYRDGTPEPRASQIDLTEISKQKRMVMEGLEARHTIYLPAYHWVLECYLQDLLTELRRLAGEKTVLFLDYETNCDIKNATRPLSHAGLIKLYLEGIGLARPERTKAGTRLVYPPFFI